METTKLIYIGKSKFKAKCSACGKEIPLGTSCFWDKPAKKLYHEFDAPNASPTPRTPTNEAGRSQGAAAASAQKPAPVSLAEADAYLEDNIKACNEAYQKQFSDLSLIYGASIMAALLTMRHGFLTSNRIEKLEERKMRAYGKIE